MAKNLVIVESPAKAKTITRFLGKDYKVLASMGHVRDLPKSKMGIDTEHNFEAKYIISPDKKKVVKQLKDELKKASVLWLATDKDREGEAIGWHLLSALKVPKDMEVKRIVFHEITKGAIQEAVDNPTEINDNLVSAQQARRILDRLVGYELSPLLWKKIRYGLSAGRVQSVAVRLIVDKEREIEAFKIEEYWHILADLVKKDEADKGFSAQLQRHKGEKIKIDDEYQAKKIAEELDGANFKVSHVEEKEVKKNPAPPFITSTLQQEASRKLHFSVKKTMMLAQQLYEGLNTGDGETGLITYMRTDSVNLSNYALDAIKKFIIANYGEKDALDTPRRYKVGKGAQEAHEAIRPVNIELTPEKASKFLEKDQLKLYELVWKRTIACQMQPAILNRVSADIDAEKGGESVGYMFRATGQTIKFPGFMDVYLEGRDSEEENTLGEKFLPKLEKGEELNLKELIKNQHFTKPPARYTEASLVKKLESEGIGRPSTYAPTIGTIISRGYVEKEAKSLRPTDLAMLVTDFLVKHFKNIVDYKFTAEMEEKLDDIEEGKLKWVPMIKDFYEPFHKNIEVKEEGVSKEDVMKEKILGDDPKTDLKVVVRRGRFGAYLQLGVYTIEEVKKLKEPPKRASLPDGMYFESITLEEALEALKLPRELGKHQGEIVTVNDGRYGPYIKVGKKNASLPKEHDPYTIDLEAAIEVFKGDAERRKKMMEPIQDFGKKDPESGAMVLVKTGRFGPYVTDGKTNASISKKLDPEKISFEDAVELLAKKRRKKK